MNIHRLKQGFIDGYLPHFLPKAAMLANRRELAKRTTTCIEVHASLLFIMQRYAFEVKAQMLRLNLLNIFHFI